MADGKRLDGAGGLGQSEAYHLAEEWFVAHRDKVCIHNPQSVHLDELLGSLYDTENALRQGLLLLRCLIGVAGAASLELMPSLSVSLEFVEQLDTQPPPETEFEREIRGEPPSLSLVERNVKKYLWEGESLQIPFQSKLVPAIDGGRVFSYYFCCRDKEDISKNWEYARYVRYAYFPNELIF